VPYDNNLIIAEDESTTEQPESSLDTIDDVEISHNDNSELDVNTDVAENNSDESDELDVNTDIVENESDESDELDVNTDIVENESDESVNFESIVTLDADFTMRGTITYNLTGGGDGPYPNPAWALAGANRRLSTTEPTHDPVNLNGIMTDVVFIGWALTEPAEILTTDDILPELVTRVTVILDGNVTVYAVWGFVTIIVEISEAGNATVIIPQWVDVGNYEIGEDYDGNITITFPAGTNENIITTIIPLDWEYDIIEGDNNEVIMVVMPPIPIMHDVTFNLNGGSIASNSSPIVISVIDGETLGAAVPAPTRSNHRFNGWQENGEGVVLSSADVAEITIDEPLTFTASWARNTNDGWISPPEEPSTEEYIPIEEEPPQEEPPIEELPIEEPTTEEYLPEEVPIEELPEIEEPPIEPYEPMEEIPIVESEPEYEPMEELPVIVSEPEFEYEEIIEEEYIEIEEPQEEEIVAEIVSVIVEFTVGNIGNASSGDVRRFRIISNPSSGLQFVSGTIPAFTNGYGLFYTVKYRTNMTNPPRIMANNIRADRSFSLLPPQLMSGEIITEIIIEFDTVPAGFRMDDTIIYRFITLDENNVANQWEVMYGDANQRIFFMGASLHNIDRLSNRENIYDAESWANLQSVIGVVQAILNNPNSTLEEIEDAYFLLDQAINELNPMTTATTETPLALGEILIAFSIFVCFIFLIVLLLTKLLKHKKRIMINSWEQALQTMPITGL